jgi:hypothetical protein
MTDEWLLDLDLGEALHENTRKLTAIRKSLSKFLERSDGSRSRDRRPQPD